MKFSRKAELLIYKKDGKTFKSECFNVVFAPK